MATTKKEIKDATKATKTKVSAAYNEGSYAKQGVKATETANSNVNNATNNAEKAYSLAAANNQQRAEQTHSTNATVTRQVGNTMRKANYSLTNRNVAGAAAARNAAGANSALSNANRNAQMTRDTSVNKAKQSAYSFEANAKAGNIKSDIDRSTQLNKTKAQQPYQAAEAKKARQLKNALQKREDAEAKRQREIKSYADTVATRYTTVRAVDKAIKKLKGSNSKYAKTKIAYLQNLRAQLLNQKNSGSGGGGGRRGGRGYGGYGRRYGSGGGKGEGTSNVPDGGGNDNKNDKKSQSKRDKLNPKNAGSPEVTSLWANRGRYILQKNEKKADKQKSKAKDFKTGKGRYKASGKRAK